MSALRLTTALSVLALFGCGGLAEIEEAGDEFGEQAEELYWSENQCFAPTDTPVAIAGDMHSHSGWSDAAGGPTARSVADVVHDSGAHFTFVTDHSSGGGSNRMDTNRNYDGLKDDLNNPAAHYANDASFLAAPGLEHNVRYPGDRDAGRSPHHLLVLFPPRISGAGFDFANELGYDGSFRRLTLEPMDDVVGGFAHPTGPGDWQPARIANQRRNARKVDFVELNGSAPDLDTRVNKFRDFLNAGFRVGPAHNSDTHHKYGDAGSPKFGSGAWVDSWSGEKAQKLRKALRQHRTFATGPGQSMKWIKLVLNRDGNDCLQGSTVARSAWNERDTVVKVTVKGSGWHRVKLITNGFGAGNPFRTDRSRAVNADGDSVFSFPALNERDLRGKRYIFAFAEGEGGKWAVTAPVWLR